MNKKKMKFILVLNKNSVYCPKIEYFKNLFDFFTLFERRQNIKSNLRKINKFEVKYPFICDLYVKSL